MNDNNDNLNLKYQEIDTLKDPSTIKSNRENEGIIKIQNSFSKNNIKSNPPNYRSRNNRSSNTNNTNSNDININSNNNNTNNNIIINSIDLPQIIEDPTTYYSPLTFTFSFFFSLNIIFYILTSFDILIPHKLVFNSKLIFPYNQFYRFISRFFIHFGIWHFFIDFFIFFYLCDFFENLMGTSLCFFFVLISILIISPIEMIINFLFKKMILFKLKNSALFYGDFEGGLSPIIFAMYNFYFINKKDHPQEIKEMKFLGMNVKISAFIFMVILHFFTPNSSFYGNFAGIIASFVIRGWREKLLPKAKWIIEIENRWRCGLKLKLGFYDIKKNFYRKINKRNKVMKKFMEIYFLKNIDNIHFNDGVNNYGFNNSNYIYSNNYRNNNINEGNIDDINDYDGNDDISRNNIAFNDFNENNESNENINSRNRRNQRNNGNNRNFRVLITDSYERNSS